MLIPGVLEVPSDATGIATGVVLFVAVVAIFYAVTLFAEWWLEDNKR